MLRAPRILALTLGLLTLASVAYAARSAAVDRGWKPALILTGQGDPQRAITAMRGAADLWRTALARTDIDAATANFTARAMESLKDFDLKGLYELLPEQNGPFRELKVSGGRQGNRYVVGRPTQPNFEVGAEGTRQQPGDTSFVLRSRGVPAPDGDTNYLIQGRGGIVVGKIGWPMVMASNQQWLRLFSESPAVDSAARAMVAIRQTTIQANPKLGPEDVELVATLWEAFPRMSYLASSLGRIEDVIVNDGAQHGATHIRLALKLDPKRMEETYPELAEYVEDLGKLFQLDLEWVDSSGRTMAKLHVDSEHRQARLELYTKDGLLVPFKGAQVFVDDAIDLSRGPLRYSTRMRSDFRMMGMFSHMRGGRIDWSYEPTARGMELRGRMTHVPTVTVDGAALGFIPAGIVDAFIPGDLESLITEFLTTACRGNEGRGVALSLRMDQRDNGVGTVDAKLGFEALNNFLVKLGLRFFNDRVMPDENVNAELKRLMVDTQGAFAADIERFARASR